MGTVFFRYMGLAAHAACVFAVMTLLGGCTGSVPGPGNGNDNGSFDFDLPGGLVLKGLPAALLSVSGTTFSDVYAVGADTKDGMGPLLLHYDGSGWRRISTGLTEGDLWWITTPPVEGQYFLSGDPGVVLRYDPATGAFERYSTPGTEILFGVWGAVLDDVWAVGGDLSNEDAGGVIWHFDGRVWTVTDVSDIAPDGLPTLYKVWGRNADEVYAVGRKGTVLRWDGASWSIVASETTRTMFTVHGNDSLVVATGGSNSGVIEELDGNQFVERAAATTPQMNGVFVPPDGQAVAVGIAGLIARRGADRRWPLQRTALNIILDFHAVWIDDEGGIWAVGGNLGSDLNSGIVGYFGERTVADRISP